MGDAAPFDNMTDEQMINIIWDSAMPPVPQLVTVATLFTALFVVGLIGNCMVIFVVLRNESMRSTTNIFLVNLAVADFLVLIFCLPPTMIWEVTKTWWFSTTMCKATLYLQHVTVAVSVLTMMAISVERYFVVSRPLQFITISNSWTIKVLAAVWICALLLGLPEPLSLEKQYYDFTIHKSNFTSAWLATCENVLWREYEWLFWTIHTILLFIVPLVVTGIMYGMVSYVLWIKPQRAHMQYSASMAIIDHSQSNNNRSSSATPGALGETNKRNSIVSIRWFFDDFTWLTYEWKFVVKVDKKVQPFNRSLIILIVNVYSNGSTRRRLNR